MDLEERIIRNEDEGVPTQTEQRFDSEGLNSVLKAVSPATDYQDAVQQWGGMSLDSPGDSALRAVNGLSSLLLAGIGAIPAVGPAVSKGIKTVAKGADEGIEALLKAKGKTKEEIRDEFFKNYNKNKPKGEQNVMYEDEFNPNSFDPKEFLKQPKEYSRDVYHATPFAEKIIAEDKIQFISKDPMSDIGFHVSLSPAASNKRAASRPAVKNSSQTLAEALPIATFPLKLLDSTKPLRIPDVGTFAYPENWIIKLTHPGYAKKADYYTKALKEYEAKTGLSINKGENLAKEYEDMYPSESVLKSGMDYNLWKNLVKNAGRYHVKHMEGDIDVVDHGEGTKSWFNSLKTTLKDNGGYDSLVYTNAYEGGGDSLMLMYPNQVKYFSNKAPAKEAAELSKAKGGSVIEKDPNQMYGNQRNI